MRKWHRIGLNQDNKKLRPERAVKSKTAEVSAFITAISTLALALLTFWLVLVAQNNLTKFIENVNLIHKTIEQQNKALEQQAEGLKQQAKSIRLQAEGLNKQAYAIDLQSKDILLNYKPVIFIKEVHRRVDVDTDAPDPLEYTFVLTNSGKLPARDVRVFAVINGIDADSKRFRMRSTIMHNASIFPDTAMELNIGNMQVPWVYQGLFKGECIFKITYRGEGLPQEMQETLKYVFDKQRVNKWTYVSPWVDIFYKEKFDAHKNYYPELTKMQFSQSTQGFLRYIAEIDIGVDKVLVEDSNELTRLFRLVCRDIRNGKHHVFTESVLDDLKGPMRRKKIRDPHLPRGIIDEADNLTPTGVSLLKCMAHVAKSDKMFFND
ncbi:MAG TPA: hypothetical protein VGJ94_08815 [Syntrophorhabdaceae bacterium]|jgi:hypothetical protein